MSHLLDFCFRSAAIAALGMSCWLTGCADMPPASVAKAQVAASAIAPAPASLPAPSPAPSSAPVVALPAVPPPAAAPVPTTPPLPPVSPADIASRRLLAYHEQLRQLSPPELAQELTRVNATISANASHASPSLVLELALVLAHTRNNGDLARALAVLDPLVRSTAPELQPWQPLARLLMGRLAEQRRLEEQLDRQSSLLREAQRNLQQTNEKLEALKAIERSLNSRPTAAPTQKPR